MKRNTEEGGQLTDSVSSRAKSNQVDQGAPSAISSQCQRRASQVTQGAAEGYLAVSELTLGASLQVDLPPQCFFLLVE